MDRDNKRPDTENQDKQSTVANEQHQNPFKEQSSSQNEESIDDDAALEQQRKEAMTERD